MDEPAAKPVATVFGGTGFLGRRIVRALLRCGFVVRVAARHAPRTTGLFDPDDQSLHLIAADVHDDSAIRAAIDGAHAVVNAVSLYLEHGRETFHSVHVRAASRIASISSDGGVQRFVHVSGLGADALSASLYIRKRGEGEAAVRAGYASAFVVRPAVMFGPDDQFLTPLRKLVASLPVFPLFGRGLTRLAPVHADDVAEAIVRLVTNEPLHSTTFELGGPGVYTYKQIVRALAENAGAHPVLLPLPFAIWTALAAASERLPNAPISRTQIDLMRFDNVVSGSFPGFDELRISPQSLAETLPELAHVRPD